MSYKYILAGMGAGAVIIGLIIFGIVIGAGPDSKQANQTSNSNQNIASAIKADKVEVFYFYSSQRCVTCLTIGRLTKETVNEFFQPELKTGKIEFREINVDLPENRILANKFRASGSSLFLNAISNGQDNIAEDINVWRLTQNETQFKTYLRNKINNFLDK